MKEIWKDQLYRSKVIRAHYEYLRNHPEELERLKKIQLRKVSKIEERVREFLRLNFEENKDFYFDQQDLTGKTLYRPDFQFPEKKVIIELYGYYKHFTKKGKQKDKVREYYLKQAGWKVYKFNFSEIEKDYKFEKVKKWILERLSNGKENLWD